MTVTSSLQEISTYQQGNRVVVRGGGATALTHPFPQPDSGQIFKEDVNGFSSGSAICFMGVGIEGMAIKIMKMKCVCNGENRLCWMINNSRRADRQTDMPNVERKKGTGG